MNAGDGKQLHDARSREMKEGKKARNYRYAGTQGEVTRTGVPGWW